MSSYFWDTTLAFPRNPKKEKVATPQEERIFTPLTRKVRLADENHNSVYRDYHYQRLNMGSAPGLRSIHPRVGLSLRDPSEAPDRVRPMSLDRSHFFDFGTPLAFAIVGVLQGAILRSMFHGLRGVFL